MSQGDRRFRCVDRRRRQRRSIGQAQPHIGNVGPVRAPRQEQRVAPAAHPGILPHQSFQRVLVEIPLLELDQLTVGDVEQIDDHAAVAGDRDSAVGAHQVDAADQAGVTCAAPVRVGDQANFLLPERHHLARGHRRRRRFSRIALAAQQADATAAQQRQYRPRQGVTRRLPCTPDHRRDSFDEPFCSLP